MSSVLITCEVGTKYILMHRKCNLWNICIRFAVNSNACGLANVHTNVFRPNKNTDY